MSLLFNMLSRLVITFLPRSKYLLISWLQSSSAVILESKQIKSATISTVSPSISHEVMGPDAMIFIFWMLSFKPTFILSFFTFNKRLFSFSSLSPRAPQNKVCHCFHCFPIYLPWSDGTKCHHLSFLKLSFKPAFSIPSFTLIKRLFSSDYLLWMILCSWSSDSVYYECPIQFVQFLRVWRF